MRISVTPLWRVQTGVTTPHYSALRRAFKPFSDRSGLSRRQRPGWRQHTGRAGQQQGPVVQKKRRGGRCRLRRRCRRGGPVQAVPPEGMPQRRRMRPDLMARAEADATGGQRQPSLAGQPGLVIARP